jgi:polar amino acid transport system substrate-binding protein
MSHSHKISHLLIALLLGATLAIGYSKSGTSTAKESVYERVMRTGTLRCGYFEEAPFTSTDPNTKKKTGIAVELADKMASDLGLKVEWVDGFSFGNIAEDLRNEKFDAICGDLFILPRAGQVDYTVPYGYVPLYAYTQAGRTEFDGHIDETDQLDWSKVTIAGLDGEGGTTIAQKKIPQAKFNILPQISQTGEMLMTVAYRKADMAVVMPTVFKEFNKNNPGKLQKITAARPFYVYDVTFGVKPGESALKNMFDYMIRRYEASGELQDLFRKYDPEGLLFRPAALYQTAGS